MANGADVNVTQHGGWTPLQQAAVAGAAPLVALLLRHGAARDARADDGRDARAMAAAHPEVLALLDQR